MRIESIMSTPARSCTPNDSLHHASEIMWNHDCGFVPVVGDDQRPIAVITDRDICMAAYTRGRTLGEMFVREAMSKRVFVCTSRDDLSIAERMMRSEQVRRLPVVDTFGRLVGIVSLSDIARNLHLKQGIFASLRPEDPLGGDSVARTFAEIVRPPQEPRIELGPKAAPSWQRDLRERFGPEESRTTALRG